MEAQLWAYFWLVPQVYVSLGLPGIRVNRLKNFADISVDDVPKNKARSSFLFELIFAFLYLTSILFSERDPLV